MSAYLMWFTRYGGTEVHEFDDIDECYSLARFLEDCDTADFDRYGCLDCVEHVGAGVIPDKDWDSGLATYIAKRRALAEEERKRGPEPVGSIRLTHPDHPGRWDWADGTAYSEVELERMESEWVTRLGRDRVSVYRNGGRS